jgi:hypothetical protein
MDPRVKTSTADLQKQHDLSVTMYRERQQMMMALNQVKSIQAQITKIERKANDKLKGMLNNFSQKLDSLEAGKHEGKPQNLQNMPDNLASVFNVLQGADVAPTQACLNDEQSAELSAEGLFLQWQVLKQELVDLNKQLKKARLGRLEY